MAEGFYVEDFDAFDETADVHDAVAASTREHGASLADAIASGATGIEGTRTADALKRLAAKTEADVNAWADQVEAMSRNIRASGKAYRDFGVHGSNTVDPAAAIWAQVPDRHKR